MNLSTEHLLGTPTMGGKRKIDQSPSKLPLKRNASEAAKIKLANGKKNHKYDIPDGSTVDSTNNRLVLPTGPTKSPRTSKSSSPSRSTSNLKMDTEISQPTSRDGKVKPIFVEANYEVTKNFLTNMTLKVKPQLKIIFRRESNPKTQIICFSIEDKIKIIEKLREHKLQFFTYSEPGAKNKSFILRGFYRAEPEEVCKLINEEGIAVAKVTVIFDHPHNPVYLVVFSDTSINMNVLYRFKTIDSVIIRWEKLDVNKKRPVQCHRCQAWGHGASNCGRNYKCVKCDQQHEPGKCSRIDRTQGQPKCVNCGGDHSANSIVCEVFIKYQQRNERRRRQQQPNQFVSYTAPAHEASPIVAASVVQPSALTQRLEKIKYSDIVSGSRNGCELNQMESLSSLGARLSAIPNIHDSLRRVEELVTALEKSPVENHPMMIFKFCCSQNGN